MASFVTTDTLLDLILANTNQQVETRKKQTSLTAMIEAARQVAPPLDMLAALQRDTVALMAEVKHASPIKGVLASPFDPVEIATTYAENGAAAVSVLTDEAFFQGSLDDLREVRQAIGLPLLCKDFIIDPFQVYEARAAGADAVLLITAVLSDLQLDDLHGLVTSLGMASLIEVHNEAELVRALRVKPGLIGINNQDLKTFDLDIATTVRLARFVPEGITLVAESGIRTASDVREMGERGAHAVLVGEALMRASDRAAAVRAFSSQPRPGADPSNGREMS